MAGLSEWMDGVLELVSGAAASASAGSEASAASGEPASGAAGGRSSGPPDYTRARIVHGGGGYVYAQFQDDDLVIVKGPRGEKDQRVGRGSSAWRAITAEIGTYSGEDSAAASTSPKPAATPASGTPWTPTCAAPRTVSGRGDYVYEQWPSGEIAIVSGPNGEKGLRVRCGSRAWEAITAEIGPVAPRVAPDPEPESPDSRLTRTVLRNRSNDCTERPAPSQPRITLAT